MVQGTDRGKFRVSLYKALLFLHIQNGVKSGTLNLQHSYKYRPLDDYLIERGRWSRDKELLLERPGLQALANPRTVLDNLDEALHTQYLTKNRNILDGKNSLITFGSINESELEHTINWYFSVDPTHAANDQVLRLIDRLELLNISRRSSDRLHTSSDGQKFRNRIPFFGGNRTKIRF